MSEEKGWKDLSRGGIILEAGNAEKYKTGSWKTFKPVKDDAKCINCLFCWMFCPEGAIKAKDGKITNIDLSQCKGCGICAKECPKDAIKMVREESNK